MTTAPASPASAAPPAINGVFAFCAAVETPCAADWAPELTVPLTPAVAARPFGDWLERLLAVFGRGRDELREDGLREFRLACEFRLVWELRARCGLRR